MRISTRLLLVLLPTVVGIMALYAAWAVRQREAITLEQTEAEARVFSSAVALAFTHAFRDLQMQDLQEILASIDDEPGIYGVVFYDPAGDPTLASSGLESSAFAPPATVMQALRGDTTLVLDQDVGGERVQSVLRTVRDREGTVVGALEVVQPLSFVEGDRIRTTRRFVLNTVTLLIALAVLLVLLVRRYVGRPIEDFASAIHRLGDGELPRRLEEGSWPGELEEAAREFDRMVSRLGTAREQLEHEVDERLALQERITEKEQLAALGTLAAGVAHQIATPLSVIGGRAEALLRRAGRQPDDARSLEIIRMQSQRITRIVRSLLHFARRPEPEMRAVDVVAATERALELFAPEFDELGLAVGCDFDESVWVRADPELLEEVLVTLLDNTLHALREPGAEPTLRVRVQETGDETVVEIQDGGAGISAEALPRVFEPFFTTRSGGTGLGLAVARGIVDQLGGRLELENARGPNGNEPTGAIARIVLPGPGTVPNPSAAHASGRDAST